jgi:hypothetical protein
MDRTARGEYQAKQKDEDGPASKRMAQPSNKSLSAKSILRSRESAGQPEEVRAAVQTVRKTIVGRSSLSRTPCQGRFLLGKDIVRNI